MTRRFSDYDTRRYPTVGVQEGYRRWSARYDAMMSGEIDLELLASLARVRWEVAAAADLACGTGRIGSWLLSRGAKAVDGVDLSPDMLEHARARGVYRRLELSDMCRTPLSDGAYELVTSVLAIEHLPALGPFYAEARRLLQRGGTLVVIGYHPHFLLNGIPTHFRQEDGSDLAIENHVHLFSDHVREACGVGLELLECLEPVVDERWVAKLPTWVRHLGRPASFGLVWQVA